MFEFVWGYRRAALIAAVIGAIGCSDHSMECRAPQYRDELGRCVIDCVNAPGAICDPDSGQVVGYHDAAAESGTADVSARDATITDADADAVVTPVDGAREGGGCDGSTACDGGCVDLQSDSMNCGGCGMVCPGAANAQATCVSAQCGFACDPGYERMGVGCSVAVPRPVGPMSTSHVTSQTPTLRWELAAGLDGATVEVCPDRTFQSTQCQTFDAVGSSGRPATALTRGVWFWRIHGRVRGAISTRTGPIWEFFVGARSAGDTSCGFTLDVNGDGLGDVAVGSEGGSTSGIAPAVAMYPGTATGPSFSAPQAVPPVDVARGLSNPSNAGDVNGDGYADLLANGSTDASGTGVVLLFAGSSAGLVATPLAAISSMNGSGLPVGVGDVNGDGYGDIAVSTGTPDGAGVVTVYGGGPTGIGATIATLQGERVGITLGAGLAAAGDIDGDGLADLLVGEMYGGDQTQGDVLVFRGSRDTIGPLPVKTINGNVDTSYFGLALAGAGDIDGDGLCDVALGDQYTMSGAGLVYVYRGDTLRGLSTMSIAIPNPGRATAHFGSVVLGAGDVDGDGYDDVVASEREGVHVYRGRATGLDLANPTTLVDPQSPAPTFGSALAAGDCDGDGRSDITVGEPYRATYTGRILYFRGGPTGTSTSAVITDGTTTDTRFGAFLSL